MPEFTIQQFQGSLTNFISLELKTYKMGGNWNKVLFQGLGSPHFAEGKAILMKILNALAILYQYSLSRGSRQ